MSGDSLQSRHWTAFLNFTLCSQMHTYMCSCRWWDACFVRKLSTGTNSQRPISYYLWQTTIVWSEAETSTLPRQSCVCFVLNKNPQHKLNKIYVWALRYLSVYQMCQFVYLHQDTKPHACLSSYDITLCHPQHLYHIWPRVDLPAYHIM